MSLFSGVVWGCATLTALMFCWNLTLFRRSSATESRIPAGLAVSVLIPARNEAPGIGDAVRSVLKNRGREYEVVVLNDQSRDRTAGIVTALAARHGRVRLVEGQPLPPGWSGKQFACHQLAQQARYDEFLFLDADVRLAPNALVRAVQHRRRAGVDLLSGFPRQVTGTLGESMLVPLIYIVLLSYLPFQLMRRTNWTAASAGCGQFFLTSRRAYESMGGHASIRGSLHDGITLPRAYRSAGLRTDVFDAADVASCRMYSSWKETWQGFSKNAHEGVANERLIMPMTGLMLLGYVAPTAMTIGYWLRGAPGWATGVSFIAAVASYLPRLITAARFDRGWLATALFPVSIVLLVILQWAAFVRHRLGTQAHWKGRAYTPSSARASDRG